MEKVMRKTMGTMNGEDTKSSKWEGAKVGPGATVVLVWVGEMIEVEREVRRVRQVRISWMIVRTLAFIWNDVDSQLCSRQGI